MHVHVSWRLCNGVIWRSGKGVRHPWRWWKLYRVFRRENSVLWRERCLRTFNIDGVIDIRERERVEDDVSDMS